MPFNFGNGIINTIGQVAGDPNQVTNPETTDPTPGATQNIGDVVKALHDALGPGALARNANTLMQLFMASPYFNAANRSITMGQSLTDQALRTSQGRSGLSRTGVGGAQSALAASSGAGKRAQLYSDTFAQALQGAMANMGLYSNFINDYYQITHPGEYSPYNLATQNYLNQRQLARYANALGVDNYNRTKGSEGFGLGDFLSALGGGLPFIGGLFNNNNSNSNTSSGSSRPYGSV